MSEILTEEKYTEIKSSIDEALSKGDTELARRLSEDALAQYGEQVELFLEAAKVYYFQKDFEKALQYLGNATELEPLSSKALYNTGLIHYELKNYEEALGCFSKIVEFDNPQIYLALNAMGNLYIEFDKYEDAIKTFKKAIALNPNGYFAGFNLGRLYYKQEVWSEAVNTLTSLYSSIPDDDDEIEQFYYTLGNAFYQNDQYDQAIDSYKRLRKIEADSIYDRLAYMYEERREYVEAAEYYRKIIDVSQDNESAWERLVYCLFCSNNKVQAIECAKTALKSFPENEFLTFQCGRLLYEANEYDDALIFIKKALE